MNDKEKFYGSIIMTITIGVLSLLGCVVIGELILNYNTGREFGNEIIVLLKMTITGLIGIIGGYIGGKQSVNPKE